MAIVTMALGIGATTALFSVVDAVLLQPMELPKADRIVAINTEWPAKGKLTKRVTGGDYLDLRSATSSFTAIGIYGGGEVGVRLQDRTSFAETAFVNPAFYDVLGVQPALGRLPKASEATTAALVTTGFAQAHFGDAARAVGQAVSVDNKAYTIVGLLDGRTAFPEKVEVWITGPNDPENQNRTAFNYRAIGRLRDGLRLGQAQAELTAVGARMAAAHPDSNKGKTFRAVSLQEQLTAPVSATLWFLFGSAGLLLLISCANVMNLMLARAATRTREMAIRVSLGSNAGRVFQLLLAEGALLGVAAAVLGIALAYGALRGLYPLLPASIPNASGILHVRFSVLLFASAVSLLTVMACSLAPAFHLGRTNLADVMKQTPSRSATGGTHRSRQLFIVAQIAICSLLCVGAALLSQSLLALTQTPMGFRTEGVLVMYAHMPAVGMPQYRQAIRTFESGLEDLRRLPGVRRAAVVMGLPTGRYGSNGSYLVEGVHVRPGEDPFKNMRQDAPYATFALASSQYFETIGICLMAGRDFNARDQYDAPFTAIISQSLARQSFGTADPIGRRIYCGLDSPKPMTIVGVVSDVRQDSPASKPDPEIYMPFQQHPYYDNELEVLVRTDEEPTHLIPAVRKTMLHLAPFLALRFTTFREMVQDSIAAPRFRAELASGFALLALVLAISGVYGILSYYVVDRRTELGLRMALGASRTSIIGLVSGRALWLALTGLLIGLSSATALSRFAVSLVYGVKPLNAVTYGAGATLVLLVVGLAAALPSWKASRLDPASVLRDS